MRLHVDQGATLAAVQAQLDEARVGTDAALAEATEAVTRITDLTATVQGIAVPSTV